MKYGYFDDKNREYVIERPDTPAPWVNYLGSPAYGAILSNNAGGYSFVRSGANGRILRYVFNGEDRPGRYLYLRDNESGDYWSASWQPVGKDLSRYRSQCRHGLGYTRMCADYSCIRSEALYYVPLDSTHEVWALTVTNNDQRRRSLTLTGYAEFTNHSNYEQDQVNLQYSLFINPGVKENAGIFSQSQGWLILAEALLGHGERAFRYFLENAPAAQNDRAEIRKLEPYCYGQFTEGRNSPHFGRSHVHWLTGTASTVMVGCVEGILGLRPDLGGLRLEPAVPSAWKEFTMDKRFRGRKLHIRVENPEGKESGFRGLWLNGEEMPEPYLPEELLKEENEVLLRM